MGHGQRLDRRYNWAGSAVPEPLTGEQKQKQKEKQKEKRRRQREKKQEKKKEAAEASAQAEQAAQAAQAEKSPAEVKAVNDKFSPAHKLSMAEQVGEGVQLHGR